MTLNRSISLSKAAWIAGFGYILMFGTAISEFAVMDKLVDMNNAESTFKNLVSNLPLFRYGIILYLINFLGDIIAAWALFILLKPVNEQMSFFTASLRIIFTIVSLATLMNLVTVVQLLQPHEYLNQFTPGQLQAQIMIAINSFRAGWSFYYVFFGLYLVLLGWLVFISKYIPRIIGACLIIAGVGWLIHSIQPYLFPNFKTDLGMITGVLELVFMVWLFLKGTKLKDINEDIG
jgi:hypothetical protein